ncbi:MAG: hypothetical protein L0K86_29175 [Actinomycetia bacterium]|nr:hypothetical protein [Actinomycetes bacterium]
MLRGRGSSPRPGDLAGARLGYVNASCSSSYFAPAILAAGQGRRLVDYFTLVLNPPWQAQIDAVVSADVRATTVLENVWLASPQRRTDQDRRAGRRARPARGDRPHRPDPLAGRILAGRAAGMETAVRGDLRAA